MDAPRLQLGAQAQSPPRTRHILQVRTLAVRAAVVRAHTPLIMLVPLALCLLAHRLDAQAPADSAAIRRIVADEVTAWDHGDAVAYSRHFAPTGTFTNIRGQFFTGYAAFLHQHELILTGFFRHTTLHQDVVSLRFLTPDVAVVEVLTAVSGVVRPPPGMVLDSLGRLRTRLLQIVERQDGEWKIVAYHNVDVKPGVPVPEPH